MAQTVLITLTLAGTNTGPFNLYSDVDEYTSAFESSVPKVDLEAGYLSVLVPDGTTIIRVMSNSIYCTNYIDIPITGITTTTTTSTTTIPTSALMYVYFTNSDTTAERGAKMWFSLNDYYTPNTPASLIPANCLNTIDLGVSPTVVLDVSYWRNDVYNTLDDGIGGLRAADGTASISVPGNSLVYDGLTGAWTVDNSVFTLDQGTNIAAFRLDSVTATVVGTSLTYYTVLPYPTLFVRNIVGFSSAFSAGATGITFFQL